MDFYTVVGGISSAITIADKKRHINSFLKKILKYVQSGSTNIIIFGAGGTGKTTLSKMLTNQDIVDHKYNETPTIEKAKISHNVFGNYLVAPGQERRTEMYLPELLRKINKGEITGIINVVSYGYHSIEMIDSYKSTKYFNDEIEENFIENYIELKRKDELSYLKSIIDHVKNTKNKFWIITLVNKQDLWWDKKDEVKNYYQEGDYNEIIKKAFVAKGTNDLVHELISCSLTPCNLSIGNDLLIKTTSGYDFPTQQQNYGKFLNLLSALIDG